MATVTPASSAVINGISRRTYLDPAFTHLIGYASLRFQTTGIERAWDDLLTGRTDPNPLRDVLNDILDRKPDPHDLTLTIDQRLEDFAVVMTGNDHHENFAECRRFGERSRCGDLFAQREINEVRRILAGPRDSVGDRGIVRPQHHVMAAARGNHRHRCAE